MELRIWLRTVVGVVVVLVTVVSPCAADTDHVRALRELFQRDPATGFVEAARMFEAPQAAGDLEAMMEIIRLVAQRGGWYWYFAVAEDMIEAAIPLAQDSGQWEILGELYTARARLVWDSRASGIGNVAVVMRSAHFVSLAEQVYEKAGKTPKPFLWMKRQVKEEMESPDFKQRRAGAPDYRAKYLGPKYHPLIDAIDEAIAEGRDADALAIMRQVLEEASADQEEPYWKYAVQLVAERVWIRGSEQLIPALHRLDKNVTMFGCVHAWSGRPDVFYDMCLRCYAEFLSGAGHQSHAIAIFLQKMSRMLQFAEANRLTRPWAERLVNLGGSEPYAPDIVNSETPPDLRRILVSLNLRHLVSTSGFASQSGFWSNVVRKAPPGKERVWAYETGMQVLDAAVRFSDTESRSFGASEAAKLFEKAGREDLAEQARELAVALTEGDPKALFKCALITAQAAAAEGRWEDVESTLEGAVGGQEASAEVLQAHLLLAQASRKLDKGEAAAEWVTKAGEVLKKADIAAAERANYFVSLASLTEEKPEKASYLERAQEAAEEAGLALLAEKIENQSLQVMLEGGDLTAAEVVLTDIVNRQEERREALAFDPRLRQQWFADNLGPYRRLLRVAALQDDAYLALSCAERMRARVLLDQLAWQKVDMGLYLPPALQDRLAALRDMRREAYGLLQQALGGQAPSEDDESRGLYMPIRGFYMPIRGLAHPGDTGGRAAGWGSRH